MPTHNDDDRTEFTPHPGDDPNTAETLAAGQGEETIGADGPGHGAGEEPGSRIGRYRLVKPIGEGGFGTVYEAEQLEPVQRRVALKIIKLGMDTREVIARFEAERQTLALMEHPHIAQVLDAGATETGRPYFVMELVRGRPITEYCDHHQYDLRQRLELFSLVCSAVQHAHQKGIIHRDIKPSNVLVGESDGKPVPKVIDFGIAKATDQRLTEKTYFTQHRQLIGTPLYMSPEQADLGSLDVDTRSDIYSLGVLLYELLTGTTPFDEEDLRSAGFGEIQRIIRDEQPPRPSTRASSLGASLNQVASLRRERSERLTRSLRGELDWIVMKCLEKDRTRRYETANGLVMDIKRYLSDEPVVASPPSRAYRLRKLVARHRTVFASSLVMALLLVAGVVGTSIGLVQARAAENQARTETKRAEMTAGFLTDMLAGVGPSVARGRDTEMLEEILSETEEKVGEELAEQPDVEGTIRSFIGTTYFDLGKFEKAEEQYRLALERHREAYGPTHADVAQDLNNLAQVHWGRSEFAEAEQHFSEALELRRRLFGDRHREVANSQRDLANVLVAQDRYTEAEAPLQEAIDIQREVLGEEHQEELAISLNSMGNLMMHLGRFPEAEPLYEEALEIHTRVLGADHPFTITDLHNMAWLAYYQSDYEKSEARFRQALETSKRIYGDSHPKLAEALSSFARCLQRLGQYEQAVASAREGLAMTEAIFGPDNLETARAMGTLALILGETGDIEENERLDRRVLEIRRAQLGEEHPDTLTTLHNIAYGHMQRGELKKAETMFRESLTAYEKAFGHEHQDTALVMNNLGRALRGQGRLEEAAGWFEKARAIRIRVLGEEHVVVTVSLHDLGSTRYAQGRLDEAAGIFEQVLEEYPVRVGPTHRAIAIARRDLAQVELARGNPGKARELLVEAREIAVAALGEEDSLVTACDLITASALSQEGSLDEADALFAATMVKYEKELPGPRAKALRHHGQHLARAGRPTEAEASLTSAYELLRESYDDDYFQCRRVIRALVELYRSQGNDGAAAQWQARLGV